MDQNHLKHRLTEAEATAFDQDGYFVVRNAIPREWLSVLVEAAVELEEKCRPDYAARTGLKPHHPLNVLDFIGRDDRFLPLIDLPTTFMRVVDILGWHIQLYHSHIIFTPPISRKQRSRWHRLGWHQDSGRLNIDIESNPRPRISLKVGFFLTDTSSTDRGNFHVLPGSHLTNRLDFPSDDTEDHPDATPIQAKPGDAVFFDRRLWHAAGRNTSDVTRIALFYGYSYRWLRPRDDMTVEHYLDAADPVRKQLLGHSPNGGFGYTSPADEDVPLKAWLEENLGTDSVRP